MKAIFATAIATAMFAAIPAIADDQPTMQKSPNEDDGRHRHAPGNRHCQQ